MNQKEKILQLASEKFLTYGVRNVTMDSLAADMGMSKRTLYELFHDKDSLVIESIRFMILSENQEYLRVVENTDDVVEALFVIMRKQHSRREEFPKVFIEDVRRYFPAVNARFYSCKENLEQFSVSFRLLEKGIQQGVFDPNLKIELVDTFIHELISMLHNSDRLHVLNPAPVDVFTNIILPYFKGICTPQGRQSIDKFFNLEMKSKM